ncbi:MAG: lactate racemase domain-containing protein, partial [Acidobacteriota bacterium]
MPVIGRGVAEGYLSAAEIRGIAAESLAGLAIDGRRVLVLVPDGTRTMPLPLMFDILEAEIGGRVAVLDFLVALGTHSPMDDRQL